MSHVAARVIGDLPGFFSVVDDDWHQDLVGFPVRLMDRGERGLLRVSPEAVVAFRYHDVLDLANQRDVGNMPVEVLAGQSSRRETGGGAHVAAGPAGTAGTERAMFRMLADQAFTHIPPLHRFTRHALSRQLLRRNLRQFEPLARLQFMHAHPGEHPREDGRAVRVTGAAAATTGLRAAAAHATGIRAAGLRST